jgi:hypothetical protein
MSRVIHTDSPGAQRQRLRRTIAEALHRLMRKSEPDEEAKDLVALIVLSLRELSAGVDRSARAWEKRGYFIKADRFRRDWEWLDHTADQLEALLRADEWQRLSVALATLAPRFSDIRIVRLTRSASLWQGCYRRLLGHG